MSPRHRVSRAAIDLIERFEGYRRKAAQLPDGRWTIGYGHTLTARQGAEVSRDDAEALLIYDLIAIAHELNERVFVSLDQNQFDALCSFAFNLGLDNFRRSGVLKRLNEGAIIQAACAMELWRKAEFEGERIVIDALVRRRAAEKALFLTPPDGVWIPAPSPVLRPLIDINAHDVVPREAPVPVVTSMEGEAVMIAREGEPASEAALAPSGDEAAPTTAAAEAITARLQTIFPEPGEEPGALMQAWEASQVHPQADFAPPVVLDAPSEKPFALASPEEDDIFPAILARDQPAPDDEPAGPDLFDQPPAANEPAAPVAEADLKAPDRVVIDDAAPFAFVPPIVHPLPEQPQSGVLSLVAMAALGLVFFAGGVFWATNARPSLEQPWLDPRIVGWLAGVAGIGFFVVALYLLLQRLSAASERRTRQRR